MVFCQLFRIEQRILKGSKHSEINFLLMHFFNNQLLILVEDLLVVYFVKVVKIDLIFVLNNVVDKTMPSVDIFRHWRRNILNLWLVIIISIVHSLEKLPDFTIFLNCWIHTSFIWYICKTCIHALSFLVIVHRLLIHTKKKAMWVISMLFETLTNQSVVLVSYLLFFLIHFERTYSSSVW